NRRPTMAEAYDGRQVVGMDLHRRRSVLVRMTMDGRKLETVRITNSPQALRAEIAKAGEHRLVVLEATYGSYWAADVLAAAAAGGGRRGWTGWCCRSPTRPRSPRCARWPACWTARSPGSGSRLRACWTVIPGTPRSGSCRASARCWAR